MASQRKRRPHEQTQAPAPPQNQGLFATPELDLAETEDRREDIATVDLRRQQTRHDGFNFGQTALFADPASQPIQCQEDSEPEPDTAVETETLQMKGVPGSAPVTPPDPPIQRQAEPEEESEETAQMKAAPGQRHPLLDRSHHDQPLPLGPRDGGAPLPDLVRAKMERSFGTDFGDVRVHEGDAAQQINALAYTQGPHIHFQPGQYSPDSSQGQALLGHELTHVVQQRSGQVATPQGKGAPINADPKLEAEADVLGVKASKGEAVQVQGAGQGLQRKDDPIEKPSDSASDQAVPQEATAEKTEATAEKSDPKTSATAQAVEAATLAPPSSGALDDLSVAKFKKAMGIGFFTREGAILKAILGHIKRFEAGVAKGKADPQKRAIAFQALDALVPLTQAYINKHKDDKSKQGSKRRQVMESLGNRLDHEKAQLTQDQGGSKDAALEQGAQAVVGDPTKGLTLKAARQVLKLGKLSLEGNTLKEIQAEIKRYEELKTELAHPAPAPDTKDEAVKSGVDQPIVQAYYCLKNVEKEVKDYQARHEGDSSRTQRQRSVRMNTLLVMAQVERKSLNLLAGKDVKATMTADQKQTAKGDAKTRYNALQAKIKCKPKDFTAKLTGFLLKAGLPTPGGYNNVELMVNIPIATPVGIVIVGGRFNNSMDRDDNGNLTTLRSEFGLSAGYHIPFFTFKGTFSGYVESKANSAEKLAKLWLYGLYQRMRQSKIVPGNLTNLLYGYSRGNVGFERAETWATGVEEEIFGSGLENTLEERKQKLIKVNEMLAGLEEQNDLTEAEKSDRRIKLEGRKQKLGEQIELVQLGMKDTSADQKDLREKIKQAESKKKDIEKRLKKKSKDKRVDGNGTEKIPKSDQPATDQSSEHSELEAANKEVTDLKEQLEALKNPLAVLREQRKKSADKKWKDAKEARSNITGKKANSDQPDPKTQTQKIADLEAKIAKYKTKSHTLDSQGESYAETGALVDLEAEVGAGPGTLGLGLRLGTGRKIDQEALAKSKKGLGRRRDRKASKKDRNEIIGKNQNNISLTGSFEAGSLTGDLDINVSTSKQRGEGEARDVSVDVGLAITLKQAFGGWSGILARALMKAAQLIAQYRSSRRKKELIAGEDTKLADAVQDLQGQAAQFSEADENQDGQLEIVGQTDKGASTDNKPPQKENWWKRFKKKAKGPTADLPTDYNAIKQAGNSSYGEWYKDLIKNVPRDGDSSWKENMGGLGSGGFSRSQDLYSRGVLRNGDLYKAGKNYTTGDYKTADYGFGASNKQVGLDDRGLTGDPEGVPVKTQSVPVESRGGDTEGMEGKIGFKMEGRFNLYPDFALDAGVFLLETSEYVIGAKTGTKASIFKAAMERGKKLLAIKRKGGKTEYISMWEESLGGKARLDKDYGFEKLNEDE